MFPVRFGGAQIPREVKSTRRGENLANGLCRHLAGAAASHWTWHTGRGQLETN